MITKLRNNPWDIPGYREKMRKAHLGQKAWNKGIKTGPNPAHSILLTGRKMPSTTGEKHWAWKGSRVGLKSLHEWVRSRLIEPKECQICKETKKLDLANISQEYKRDLNDWEFICRRCHMTKDGRIYKNKRLKK